MDFGPNRKQKKLTAVGISVQDLGNVFFVAASGLWKLDVDETKIRWPTVRADYAVLVDWSWTIFFSRARISASRAITWISREAGVWAYCEDSPGSS
jgi:hypothetical protein